jgi:uncharacterized protein
MPHLALWQWIIGCACAFMVGVAKTGVPGGGILAVPLMVLSVGDARLAAGWLLPILCIADIFGVSYWRRHVDANRLFALAPWVLAGMAGGAAALSLSEHVLRPAIGVILLSMVGVYVWRRRQPETEVAAHTPSYGAATGFASTVANAAGPVSNLYFLSARLPKKEFVATRAWLFFFVNLTKIPIYSWHGLFSAQSLLFDFWMIPATVVGAITGGWIVHHIPQKLFETIVIGLSAVSSLLLFG